MSLVQSQCLSGGDALVPQTQERLANSGSSSIIDYGWRREALSALWGGYVSAGFVWGKSDCATWFGDAVKLMTGVDPVKPYRTYSTESGALRILTKEGYL
jgi:hypothetical protein